MYLLDVGKAKNSNKVICYNIDFVSSVLAGSYSMLTPDQIFLLEAQGNRSSNWGGVKLLCPAGVSFDSSLDKIRGCYFNGNIFIGLFVKTTTMSGGVSVVSGLYNSNFSGNCILSDNCYVWNTAMLMNVYVGRNTCIVGCGSIICDGHTSFGTSRMIKIGCEGPGTSSGTGAGVHRDVVLSVRSTFADVCASVFLRQDRMSINDDGMDGGNKAVDDGFSGMLAPSVSGSSSQHAASLPIGGMSGMVGMGQSHGGPMKPKRAKYNRNDGHVRFDMTIICDDVEIVGCTSVRNSFVGSYSNVRDSNLFSSTALAHCEITSSHLVDAVMHQSCKAVTGSQLNGVLMFPNSTVAAQAKVSDAVLGPDSSVSVGECRHSVLGPHVGFHHQALLIASSWPMGRGNIAYGAMIGMLPLHCCLLDCFLSLCCFIYLTTYFLGDYRSQPHESQQRPGVLPRRGQLLRPGLVRDLPLQQLELPVHHRGLQHRLPATEDLLPLQPHVQPRRALSPQCGGLREGHFCRSGE